MLINRKKLKNRKKKIKIILTSALFIISACSILGYFLWTIFLSKAHYISPLASNIPTVNSVDQEKKINQLENMLREKQIEFNSVNSSGETYIIHLKKDAEAIISPAKDLNLQISSLQFIIFRLTMEGRQFSRLDLRYDKPIIVFK